ncbi:FAD binding domain-containing protein [Spongiactinospora sp. 9N601]|uniref:FAD binding domain-containing protein n=1 Tax=Spongiactinospora sp. 9N601 TaxID=3375149 RepID=UPI0037B63B13
MTEPTRGALSAVLPFLAGGTDLIARAAGEWIDLRDRTELAGITWQPDGSARIGALTTIAELARDQRLRAGYPALAATAAELATPQIRAVATLGGNLLQRNRCAYFRAGFACHQNGGACCPARAGIARYGTVVGSGPCVAPHPSSLAMALLAYDATVEVEGRGHLPVASLYGEDPTRDHLLAPGELLLGAELPPPVAGERAAYVRATGRVQAEWPLAEAVARLVVAGGSVVLAAVAAGGVARTPVRLPEVETALLAGVPIAEAAARAATRCAPLPETRYKVALLTGTVEHVLTKAIAD